MTTVLIDSARFHADTRVELSAYSAEELAELPDVDPDNPPQKETVIALTSGQWRVDYLVESVSGTYRGQHVLLGSNDLTASQISVAIGALF
jgi:hypothetical protein